MIDEKNIQVLEAVAEVLKETRNDIDLKIEQSSHEIKSLKDVVSDVVKTNVEKQESFTLEVNKKLNEVKADLESKQAEEIKRIAEEVKQTTQGILSGVKSGVDGKDGRDGVDGRDRPLVDVLTIEPKDKVEKNAVISHKGGLFVSGRKANGNPDNDPSAYNCILNGVEGVDFQSLDQRKTVISVKMSDGLHIEHILENHSPIFKGTFDKEATYEIGDIIIKDKKTLIKIADEGEQQWKMFVFPDKGEKGDAGIQGEQGIAGVGIKDVIAENNNLLIELDDGTVKSVQIGLPSDTDDGEGWAIKKFRGQYNSQNKYVLGDVVRHGNSIWIATVDTENQPQIMGEDWERMFAFSSTNTSSGSGSSTPAVDLTPYAKITYVDAGDALSLSNAKTYAEQVATKALNDSIAHSDLQDVTQKDYIDSQDSAKLAEAKAYTDLVFSNQTAIEPPIGVTEAQVDAKDSQILSSANAHSDLQDTATLNSSKAYTDSKIGVSTDANNTAKLGSDGKIFVPVSTSGAATTEYLPLSGGQMTGAINAPTNATAINFTNTYSLYSANGGVSFRFGAVDLMAFANTAIYAYKPIIATATGIGVQFGTGGGYLAKVGTGMGVYTANTLRFAVDTAAITAYVPVVLPADPTTALQAVTKQYVDNGFAPKVRMSDGKDLLTIIDELQARIALLESKVGV